MNKRIRTGILVVLVAVGVIAIGFLALNSLVRQSLTPPPVPTSIPLLTDSVVVASHDIALGTLLKASDISLIEVPVGLAPRDVITDPDQVLGKILKIQMVAGEMLLSHNLADPTNVNHDLAFVINEDMVLMAFPASDLMSQLSLPQRGDIVDLFVSIEVAVPKKEAGLDETTTTTQEEETESRLLTFDAFQQVGVTALVVDVIEQEGDQAQTSASAVVSAETGPAPTPTPAPANVKIKAYLLALQPQDALVLKHLVDLGSRFDFVLRNPTSTELFELSPVMEEYLIDRYQLFIEK